MTRIALIGATGFVGSAVLNDLLRHTEPAHHAPLRIRILGRRPTPQTSQQLTWQHADLAEPATLHRACQDMDILLHLAPHIGPDEDTCRSINDIGTKALMAEAARAGVRRIIHLSTSAVYGPGPHDGIDVDAVTPAPHSPASRTRLAGERHALAADATVLRPGLITGRGDRWVVPALHELRTRIPYQWDSGRARLSLVDVDDLARLIRRLATAQDTPRGIHHASHPRPVHNADLMAVLEERGDVPPAHGDLPWPDCISELRRVPGKVSERQFALLAQDHWYRSDAVWMASRTDPGPGPVARLAEAFRQRPGRQGATGAGQRA
ncbi:NAD-dependent epimerase/dehydratase family protein [Streptomyces sp. NPDC021212]|uniref:NAD-dependent epimerase/dehydratase family protein n=1 Tax=Streptomyces sp. NPDC021212 TaxID=3365118 RepID=UPI0037B08B72